MTTAAGLEQGEERASQCLDWQNLQCWEALVELVTGLWAEMNLPGSCSPAAGDDLFQRVVRVLVKI